jgi:LysR family glycine cleavage system transcriptional activator
VETDAAFQGARFEQFVMITEAAIHHAGAALIPRFFIEQELASGRLVRLFDVPPEQRNSLLLCLSGRPDHAPRRCGLPQVAG